MKDWHGAPQKTDVSGGNPVNYIAGSDPSRSPWPKIIVISLVLIAILSLATWLLLSERIIVTFGKPETQTAPSVTVVCATPVVDRYNEAVFVRPSSSNPSELSVDVDDLNQMAADIKGQAGYEQDPTCQTILFWIAYRNEDESAAKAAHIAVRDMHAEGRFANSNLRNNMALFEWGSLVHYMKPTTQSTEDSEYEDGR